MDAVFSTPRVGARREFFPDLPAHYLNYAAISPISAYAKSQMHAIIDDYARGGMSGFMTWLPKREALRDELAAFLEAESRDCIGFVQNTTAGVSHIAQCIDWKKGDTIILFHGEFPANVTPWQRAAESFDLNIKWVPLKPFLRSHEEGLASLRSELDGARLVAVSAVQFQTGLRMPIEKMATMCRSQGVQLFVDAIQGLGAVPMDLREVDYVSCGGHKWMMGVEGAGFIYVAAPRLKELLPRIAGWLSHENALDFLFEGPGHLKYDRAVRKDASAVELGTVSAIGYAALGASLELHRALSIPVIFKHIQAFHDIIEPVFDGSEWTKLRYHSVEGRSGSLCVSPPSTERLHQVKGELDALGVHCTTPDGMLRFAPHWPNPLDEARQLRSILEPIIAAKG